MKSHLFPTHMDYQIRAALHEEAREGWAWVTPSPNRYASHLRIRNAVNGRRVFCEQRIIDENFRRLYNGRESTQKIPSNGRVLVLSAYYRDRLGIEPGDETVNLEISAARRPVASLKAGWTHPSAAIRLATWLGLVAVVVGFLGLVTGLIPLLSAWP